MLRFKSPPDYERPQGGGTGNTDQYMYAVTVPGFRWWSGHNRYAKAVTVEITNVEEAGMIMLSHVAAPGGRGKSRPRWTDGDGHHWGRIT